MAAHSTDETKALEAEVMQIFETEPSGSPGGNALVQPDIPSMREQLAFLVSTGKAKESVGVHLPHEQVKGFTDKKVEKHYKRYETYVGAKTTETLIESFLTLATKAVGVVVRVKDADALQNELKNDYIITKELSAVAGGHALRCGRLFAVTNAELITTKHIDFNSSQTHPSRDAAGYPFNETPGSTVVKQTAE